MIVVVVLLITMEVKFQDKLCLGQVSAVQDIFPILHDLSEQLISTVYGKEKSFLDRPKAHLSKVMVRRFEALAHSILSTVLSI